MALPLGWAGEMQGGQGEVARPYREEEDEAIVLEDITGRQVGG